MYLPGTATMTYALHPITSILPTTQARTRRCSSLRPSSASAAAVHSRLYPVLASDTTGTGRDQTLIVRSIPNSRQHAYVQQGSPDFSSLDLTLQQQWDVAANAHLGTIVIKPQSHKKVWWLCDQCPDGHLHSWSASVQNRSNGNGCPQCSGRKVCRHNSLATKAPGVAAQWDYEANAGTPQDVVAHSNHTVHWLCSTCGHPWSATIQARVSQATGCPQCAKVRVRKWTKRPTFARHPLLAEWDHKRNSIQGNYPDSTSLQSNKQIFWLCHNCPAGQQHSWAA